MELQDKYQLLFQIQALTQILIQFLIIFQIKVNILLFWGVAETANSDYYQERWAENKWSSSIKVKFIEKAWTKASSLE